MDKDNGDAMGNIDKGRGKDSGGGSHGSSGMPDPSTLLDPSLFGKCVNNCIILL